VGNSPLTNGTTGIVHDLESKNDHLGKNIEKLQGDSPRDIDLQKDHNMIKVFSFFFLVDGLFFFSTLDLKTFAC